MHDERRSLTTDRHTGVGGLTRRGGMTGRC